MATFTTTARLVAPPSHITRLPSSGTSFSGQRLGVGARRSSFAAPLSRSRTLPGVCASWRGGGGSPGIADRAVASLPYLLPLFDGLRYSKFIFYEFPAFGAVFSPLQPLIKLYFSVPFASIACFFAVYLLIINNTSMSRFVRFNAMQAVLLDIILILPGLLESVLQVRPMGGLGLQLYSTAYNTIFFFLFASVVFGVGSCIIGKTARLPLVAEAADAQVR